MSPPLRLLALIPLVGLAAGDYDCYKFSPSEFTTIVECAMGCEYSYRQGEAANLQQRLWGGCGDGTDDCRNQPDGVTVCGCVGNKCNEKGYQMSDRSVEVDDGSWSYERL